MADFIAGIFALVGFAVVLLPLFLRPWRSFVENAPFLAQVFHDYSTFSGWALVNLLAGMLTTLAKQISAKHFLGGPMPSYKDIAYLEIYPRTKKEEITYWIDVAGTVLVTTVWLFLPFGVLAYFIRAGGMSVVLTTGEIAAIWNSRIRWQYPFQKLPWYMAIFLQFA